MMATLITAAILAQQPAYSDREMLAKANLTRVAMGSPPFVWDEQLARCAREVVRNGWDSHEDWGRRAGQYGASAEGSFPGAPSYTLDQIFLHMLGRMRLGVHAHQFRDHGHTRIGMAYGGRGTDWDGDGVGDPFFCFTYGR